MYNPKALRTIVVQVTYGEASPLIVWHRRSRSASVTCETG